MDVCNMRSLFRFILLTLLAAATCAGAASAPKSEVVSVKYGSTRVQLTGDGVQGLLIKGRRDNGNAHGFDVLSIYALAASKEEPAADLLVVPVWDANDEEQLQLTAGGGADCKLHNFRFMSTKGQDLQLITADREFGSSYIDPGIVTFTYFQLMRNTEGEIGRPPYYFEAVKTSKSVKAYCDVDEALKHEIG